MGTRDLSSSSSEIVTKRLWFSAIKCFSSTQILSENCKKVVFPRLVVNADRYLCIACQTRLRLRLKDTLQYAF